MECSGDLKFNILLRRPVIKYLFYNVIKWSGVYTGFIVFKNAIIWAEDLIWKLL